MPQSFLEIRLPTCIEKGATGGPRFKTTILETGGGHEYANIEWAQRRGAWDVSQAIKTTAEYNDLLAFFQIVRGKAIGFRFRDWSDYLAEAHNLGTGDNILDAYPLQKTYTYDGQTYVRKITKPVAGNTKVYFDSVEETSGWTVDDATGLITFVPRVTVNAGDIIAVDEGGGIYSFQSTSTDLTIFDNGERIRTSDWVNSANNGQFVITAAPTTNRIQVDGPLVDEPSNALVFSDINIPWEIKASLAEAAKNLNLLWDIGTMGSIALVKDDLSLLYDVAKSDVTVESNPAPETGVVVTADFWFDVPVRFDTDHMRARIEEYNVFTWGNIPLEEIRTDLPA